MEKKGHRLRLKYLNGTHLNVKCDIKIKCMFRAHTFAGWCLIFFPPDCSHNRSNFEHFRVRKCTSESK